MKIDWLHEDDDNEMHRLSLIAILAAESEGRHG